MNEKSTYRELKEKYIELEDLINLSADMIGLGNLSGGCFTRVNLSFGHLLGYTDEEFLAVPFLEFVHPEDFEETKKALGAARTGSSEISIENRYKCKDGSYKWIDWRVLADVKKDLFFAIGRDITGPKEDAKKLIDTKQELEHVLATSAAVVYRCEPSGNYPATFITKNVKNILGYEPDEFTEQPGFWASHIHPDDASRVFAELQDLLAKDSHMHEYRFLHKDGSYRRLFDSLRILKDKNGKNLDIIGTFIDITEHKRLEKLLRERTEILETILDNIPVMIAFFDGDKNLKLVNRYYEKTMECPLEKAMDPGIWAQYFPDPHYRRKVLDFIAASKSNWGDFKVRTLGGRTLDTLWANIPLKDGSNIGIGIDITERKQIEKELAKQKKALEESNLALRIVLRESELTKTEITEAIIHNIKSLVEPYFVDLASTELSEHQRFLVKIIQKNIEEIAFSFSRKIQDEYSNLTPREIQIASLIKQGRTTKEIAGLLKITPNAIIFHRRNLRKKLNIKDKKINLRDHLLQF